MICSDSHQRLGLSSFRAGLGGIGLETLEKVQTLEGEEALMAEENLPKPSGKRKLP